MAAILIKVIGRKNCRSQKGAYLYSLIDINGRKLSKVSKNRIQVGGVFSVESERICTKDGRTWVN